MGDKEILEFIQEVSKPLSALGYWKRASLVCIDTYKIDIETKRYRIDMLVSGMNAFYISTSRLMYAMAKEGSLPKWFGYISPKYGTPRNAIIFTMCASLFAPWFGREVLGWIVDMTSVGAAIVFAYTTASASIIAKRNGDKKNVWLGIIGCIFSIFFLSLLIIPGMPGFLSIQSRVVLLIWIGLGIAFYLKIRKSYVKGQN